MTSGGRSLFDAAVYSSVWLAGAAGMLVAAASRGMGISPRPAAVGLAVSGTLLVYNVDRLRDLRRDLRTAPRRTQFVASHRFGLVALAVVAGVAAAAFGVAAGPAAGVVLLPALVLGLFHRRLKRFAQAKTAYITASWLVVVVGLPVVLEPTARHVGWVAFIVATALTANAIASNVRDLEAGAARFGPARALAVARVIAGFGLAVGLLAPGPAGALVAVPLATLAALLAFRSTERFGLVAVDGALLAGSVAALALT